jgi:hypothetical protein
MTVPVALFFRDPVMEKAELGRVGAAVLIEKSPFLESHSRHFAPSWANSDKKPGESQQNGDGKWRGMALFGRVEAPFSPRQHRRPRMGNSQSVSVYVYGLYSPRATWDPPNRQSSAIFL